MVFTHEGDPDMRIRKSVPLELTPIVDDLEAIASD